MNKSPKNLIKIMEKRGWKLARVAGRHHMFKHPIIAETISIPVHGNKDISHGLFLSLIKKLEIDKSEL